MIEQMFHIYHKNTKEVIVAALTVEEMETMIAERKVDWKEWEIECCHSNRADDSSY